MRNGLQMIASRRRHKFPFNLAAIGIVLAIGACQQPGSSNSAAPAEANDSGLLGRIDFPNSGAQVAQGAFLDGVLYLHNFEYDDARRAFQEAHKADPEFALAYWGEAMTHNHPIWQRQDREQATEALKSLAPTPAEQLNKAPTAREKDYLRAAHVLFGLTEATQDLDKEERDDAFRTAMAQLSAAYPEDNEARAFHSLAILGTAHEGRDFRTYMQAAAVADQVWEVNDQHPGAAHYLIHSYDDPVHAPLGLPMALAYAKIAPNAGHAQHMTSHIFVALGRWDDVATANEAARRVQTARQRELSEPETVCGHYPYWLQYAYLQQGRFADAREVLATCEDRIEAEPTDTELWHYAVMRGRQVLDTPDSEPQPPSLVDIATGTSGFNDHLFVSGYLAALKGDLRKARATVEPLRQAKTRGSGEIPSVQAMQIQGLVELAEGKTDGGLRTLLDAALAEEAMPYAFGPPEIIKPAWELLGEQQLAAQRPAVDAFRNQLKRTPRRVQALQGLQLALRAEGEKVEAERVDLELRSIARGSS